VGILCQALFLIEVLHFHLRVSSNVVIGLGLAGILSVREWAIT
jgi:hypothetical protein